MSGTVHLRALRIGVDFDLGESNALCTAAAPEALEVRDDDLLHLPQEQPSEELRQKVVAVARSRPRARSPVID